MEHIWLGCWTQDETTCSYIYQPHSVVVISGSLGQIFIVCGGGGRGSNMIDRGTMYPKFDPIRVRVDGLQIITVQATLASTLSGLE